MLPFNGGNLAVAASWLLLLRIASATPLADPHPDPQAAQTTPTNTNYVQTATTTPAMNALTAAGCFSTPEPMIDHGPYIFQSKGNCQPICYQFQMPVMGLVNGTNCWCGALLPPANTKVDDGKCNTPCSGYDQETCGGDNVWQVYLTGVTRNKIQNLDPASLSGTMGAPSKTASVSRATSSSLAKSTSSSSASSTGSSAGGGSSKVGVAVGVVIGVVAIIGLIVGVVLFLKHKRRRDAEDEYKRQAAVSSFVNGKGGHSNTPSLNDSRLDPDLLTRRESTGTIADNQDYSRRILKIRNPDGF